jgi:hypothetical protein
MNHEQQRIAIAKACGRVQRPDGFWFPQGSVVGSQGIPDYLNDLNAMHEAEKIAFKNGIIWGRYFDELLIVCGEKNDVATATAAQRAEAFLKTLNLWETL